MMTSRFISLFIASTALLVTGQQPSDDIAIGQEICTYGYMMDELCIDIGNLLDAKSYKTLENPEQHTLACLVQARQCYETPFHILTDPDLFVGGSTTYGPGWALSDNAVILEQTRALAGTVNRGLRMEVRGTVVTMDPPVIDFMSAELLVDGAEGCTGEAPPPAATTPDETDDEENNNSAAPDPTTDDSAAAIPGTLLSFTALILAAL